MAAELDFFIPESLNASSPAEYSGRKREEVRLLVIDSVAGTALHDDFVHIGHYLKKGDLLVLNSSRTIPAVMYGELGGKAVEVRLSRRVTPSEWEALMLHCTASTGDILFFPGGLEARLTGGGSEEPLVRLEFSMSNEKLFDWLYRFGKPVRYEYINGDWPLDAYQTVYASSPGSVEMPSAGRAFSWKLLQQLRKSGIKLAFLQLHAGLSYYGNDRWPHPEKHPEWCRLPAETADLINRTKQQGGRVIAVGTTAVRTLETAADSDGHVTPFSGLTNVYVNEQYKLKTADGLLTGLHEPEASHLDMLSAFTGRSKLMEAYRQALSFGYFWHEFGDMNLILPMES